MGFLGFRKKRDEVLDLSDVYRKKQEQLKQMREESKASKTPTFANSSASASENAFGFLGGMANAGSSNSTENLNSSQYLDASSDSEEKRKRFTKRIMGMTDKLEELSNQIYHLEQRLEVLEKKSGVGTGY